MTDQQLRYLTQLTRGGTGGVGYLAQNTAFNDPFRTDPTIEPGPIPPSGGYLGPHHAVDYYPQNLPPNDQGKYFPPNFPHVGVDFPTGINTPHQAMDFSNPWGTPDIGYDLPPSPDFGPSDQYLPNDYGPATVMTPSGVPGPYNPGIYDPNTYTPYADFSGGGGYSPPNYSGGFDTTGEMQTPPGSGYAPTTYDVSGTQLTFGEPDFGGLPAQPPATYDVSGTAQTYGEPDFGGLPVGEISNAPPLGSDWPYYVNEFPTEDTSAPGAGNAYSPDQQGVYDPTTLVESNNAPWYPGRPDSFTWSADRNVYADPQKPGLLNELRKPTNYQAVGQFFKDTAGNIVDATGKVIAAAGNAAKAFANNIMNDPGYSSPDYLRSIGYTPGAGGTEQNPSLWPGQTSNTGFGAGGRGGTFFGGSQNFNPGLSSPYQGFTPTTQNPGQVVRSSVGPPQGASGPDTGGTMLNTGSLWGGIFDRQRWERLRKGLYTTPQNFGLMKEASPSPTGGNIFNNTSFQQFHQGQVTLGDMLRANPSLIPGPRTLGEAGKPARVGGGTPPTLPR